LALSSPLLGELGHGDGLAKGSTLRAFALRVEQATRHANAKLAEKVHGHLAKDARQRVMFL